MHAEPKRKVEDILAVFEENAVVSRLAPYRFGTVPFGSANTKDRSCPRSAGERQRGGVRRRRARFGQSANARLLRGFQCRGLRVGDGREADSITGLICPTFHNSAPAIVTGHTKPRGWARRE